MANNLFEIETHISNDWREILEEEFQKEYFEKIKLFLSKEYQDKRCFPPVNEIFNAFKYSSFKNTKVVIIGQDPYHGENQAHGLAFSVRHNIKLPPSLKNIYKELALEYEMYNTQQHGDLSRWAKQGVLLLNATLTVEQNKAGSHQKKGWENFTDEVINKLNCEKENLVFILWGGFAKKKGTKIDATKHMVLESNHPSPLSANRGGWFGNNHFKKTNEYLKKHNLNTIEW